MCQCLVVHSTCLVLLCLHIRVCMVKITLSCTGGRQRCVSDSMAMLAIWLKRYFWRCARRRCVRSITRCAAVHTASSSKREFPSVLRRTCVSFLNFELLVCIYSTGIYNIRDEFTGTVKILHSSFCDTKIELRSSWCDLCSSFFGVLEKKLLNSVTLSQLNQSRKLKIVLPLQRWSEAMSNIFVNRCASIPHYCTTDHQLLQGAAGSTINKSATCSNILQSMKQWRVLLHSLQKSAQQTMLNIFQNLTASSLYIDFNNPTDLSKVLQRTNISLCQTQLAACYQNGAHENQGNDMRRAYAA